MEEFPSLAAEVLEIESAGVTVGGLSLPREAPSSALDLDGLKRKLLPWLKKERQPLNQKLGVGCRIKKPSEMWGLLKPG